MICAGLAFVAVLLVFGIAANSTLKSTTRGVNALADAARKATAKLNEVNARKK